MRTHKIMMAVLASMMLAACAGKEEMPQPRDEKAAEHEAVMVWKTFTAKMDETKTSLSGGTRVLWDASDAISVIATDAGRTRSTLDEITVSQDGRTATFSGMTALGNEYFAIYPAQSAQLATDFKTLTLDLPWSQTATAGSFADGTNVAVAYTDGTEDLMFRNVGSLLSFSVTSSTKEIAAVRLDAEAADGRSLTGRAAVEFDDAGIPYVSDMVSTCGSAHLTGPIATGSKYYFVIYPGEYSDITLRFIATDGSIATYTNSKTLSAGRSKSISMGSFAIPDSKWVATGSDVYTRLSDSLADYSGNYLIVYEEGGLAFNGSLSTLDAPSNTFSVEITDGTIPVTDATKANEFVIAASSGKYTIRSASGKYIGQASNNNGLTAGSSPLLNSISGIGTIVSAEAHLRYNDNNDQKRFRYYKSSSYTGQQAIALYARTEGGEEITDPVETEAKPLVDTEDDLYAPAEGGTDTSDITLIDADGWDVSISYSGCVTNATLSSDRTTITYTVGANTTASTASGAVIITLSKSGCPDVVTSIPVTQEAGEEEEGDGSWQLVTLTSSLKAGDVLIFASNEYGYVAGTLSSQILTAATASFSSDKKTVTSLPETASIFTLGGTSGAWTFTSSNGALGCTAEKRLAWGNGTTTWTISIGSDATATVKPTSDFGTLQYNSDSPRFTTYKSSQKGIQIYRRNGGAGPGPSDDPYVRTSTDIAGISTSGATVSATFFSGSAAPSAAFFKYGSTSDNLSSTVSATTPSTASGSFSATIAGLSENSWCWYQACITVGGTTYSGSVCSFKTASSSSGTSSGACRGWFELPAQKDSDKNGIDDDNPDYYYSWTMRADAHSIRNFSSCYSKSMIHPVWVAAPMHSCYLGSSGRTNSYGDDPNIGCAQNSKFTGYTRGHMVGSSDRTVSSATNRQAFYYSNIGAQLSSGFNTGGGAWNNLEDFVDGQMCSDTLYQVIGCIFETFTDKYGSTISKKTGSGTAGTFQVPTAWYKVLLRTKAGNSGKPVNQCSASELKCAAFILAHKSNASHKPNVNDMYTVAEVEELTGLTFFVNVPEAPKTTAIASEWGF